MILLSNALDYLLNPFSSISVFIWAIFLVLALRNIWTDSARGETNKIIWSLIVFFFPFGGVIIWWLFSKK